MTGPCRGPSVVQVGRAFTWTTAALVVLDAAVADVSGLVAPVDVQSLGTGQENIDLRGTGNDV